MSENGPSISQLRALMKARQEDEAAQAVAKGTAERKREIELEVHEAEVWAGIKGEYKRDLGPPYGTQGFTARETETGYVYNLEEFTDWAVENGYEEAFLKERAVNQKAVNQHVKRAKRGQAEMPAGVEPRGKKFVSVREIK